MPELSSAGNILIEVKDLSLEEVDKATDPEFHIALDVCLLPVQLFAMLLMQAAANAVAQLGSI